MYNNNNNNDNNNNRNNNNIMYTYVYIHTYIYIYVHNEYICIYICICTHSHVVCIYCMSHNIYIYITCIIICVYVYIYIYIYIPAAHRAGVFCASFTSWALRDQAGLRSLKGGFGSKPKHRRIDRSRNACVIRSSVQHGSQVLKIEATSKPTYRMSKSVMHPGDMNPERIEAISKPESI